MKIVLNIILLIGTLFISSCDRPIQLIDYYYIYPQDNFGDGYYLMCKLGKDPKIENLELVKWNNKYIVIKQKNDSNNCWFVIKSRALELKCSNGDTLIGPITENEKNYYLEANNVNLINEIKF
ncbi:MAG: hypothetical protein WC121_04480 [Candidatus Kapaibacterium sp.]